MALFQKSVINMYLRNLDRTKVSDAYDAYKKIFTVEKTNIIKELKEEEYQDGFLRDLFQQLQKRDQMVYKLYELTDEEIRIVEGSV